MSQPVSQPLSQPLKTQSHLFSNPEKNPHFSVTIRGAQGQLQVADPLATRALIALMDMHAVLGGAASHYGGPAAFAELMAGLHGYMFERANAEKKQWHELFHFVNDAGHCENGLYALKANYGVAGVTFDELKTFRSIEGRLAGHGETHLFPEGVLLSNGPLGSAFPKSQGLAMAEAMVQVAAFSGSAERQQAPRLTVTAISDGACMEGEAREAMASLPGLAKRRLVGPFLLIISDNNTKLSGRIDQESFSMEPSFEALRSLGWKVMELRDGHDLQACYDTIRAAAEEARARPQTPIAIHARTIKGIGTQKTQDSSSGGHGFPCKSAAELTPFIEEIYQGSRVGRPVPKEFHQWIAELVARETQLKDQVKAKGAAKTYPLGTGPEEKIQNGISAALVCAAREGLPVVSIAADLPGSTGTAGFRKEFPTRSIDVGVAESNMISIGAGFAIRGFIPVVDTFAQFGVTKGALPLLMASLSHAPVIAVFSHTGFQDAADGASHQALNYLAMTGGIPRVRVIALTCSEEAEALMLQALQEYAQLRKQGVTPPSTIFFLGRENFPKSYGAGASGAYRLGGAQILADTTKGRERSVCLVAPGSLLPQALMAQAKLGEKGIGAIVVNPSSLNSVDRAIFLRALEEGKGNVIVAEDHQVIGGYGQFLKAQLPTTRNFVILGVHGHFGQSAYNSIDLYRKHKMDAAAIVDAAVDLFGEKDQR
ncbi:MAG: transketolase [Bdellovibrio sp.]|nr:MAG: transketolase [Bdellovibrio sp.]